jgi:hypothetical protein
MFFMNVLICPWSNLNEPELSGWHLSVLPRLTSPALIARISRKFCGLPRVGLAGAARRPYIRRHRVSAERLGLAAIDAPD